MSEASSFEQIEVFEEETVTQLKSMVNAWLALEKNLDIQITHREYAVASYAMSASVTGASQKSYSLAIFYKK